jgi:hypothetical protein
MNNHIVNTNKMVSETPRMDASAYDDGAIWETGCDIERELNTTSKERDDALMMLGMYRMKSDEQKQRIKRLEEALIWYESTVSDCNRHGPEGDAARDALAQDLGRKAKEAKQ